MKIIILPYKQELLRKLLRLALLPLIVAYLFSDKTVIILVMPFCAMVVVCLDFSRHTVAPLQKISALLFDSLLLKHENSEQGLGLSGASYLFISASIAVAIFPQSVFITAYFAFIVADILVTIINREWGKIAFVDKTIEGIIAYIVVTYGLSILTGIWLHVGWEHYFASLIAAIIGGVMLGASALFPINSNFTVPLSFGACLYALQTIASL